MRLSTFFFLVLGAGALGGTGWFLWKATEESRAWREMLKLSEKRGRRITSDEEVRFQTLAAKRVPGETSRRAAEWVAEVEGPPRRFLVLYSPIEVLMSGDTLAQIHLFDINYRRVGSILINLGRGHRDAKAAPDDRTDLGGWAFQLHSQLRHVRVSQRITQHLVLIKDEPVLVRLEDDQGRLLRNEYEDADATIGPPLPNRTPEAWEETLSSSNPAEVLRTLTWLAGRHGRRRASSPARDDAIHFDEVRRRPAVLQKVTELTRSPHPWVAEAAELALPRLQPKD